MISTVPAVIVRVPFFFVFGKLHYEWNSPFLHNYLSMEIRDSNLEKWIGFQFLSLVG